MSVGSLQATAGKLLLWGTVGNPIDRWAKVNSADLIVSSQQLFTDAGVSAANACTNGCSAQSWKSTGLLSRRSCSLSTRWQLA